MQDTEYGGISASIFPEPRQAYIEHNRQALQEGIELRGVVWLIDSANAITQLVASQKTRPQNIDALEQIVIEYLDQHYPTTNLRRT